MANFSAGNLNLFQRFTYSVVTSTESFFYQLGVRIGHKPKTTILICWCMVLISSLGFIRFHQEKNPMKLWVPPHTSFVQDSEWLMKTFQKGYRTQIMLITADNVLSPDVLQKVADIGDKVRNSRSENNVTWTDVCFKIPKLDKGLLAILDATSKPNTSEPDPSLQMNLALYCSFVETMQKECLEKSILELWDFNKTEINSLTYEDIIYQVNFYDRNSLFGRLKSYEDLLGGIERNASGYIIGAKALHNIWMVNVNFSAVDMDESGNIAGTADWANMDALDWETKYLEIMSNESNYLNDLNQSLFYMAGRSFGDISGSSMFQDMPKLLFGVFIMVLYVQFVISKFNWLEARVILGCLGLLTIGMSFVVGCGLCSLFGVYYGPVHTSLPFLLMGLGIDDMLVILACWDEISHDHKIEPLPDRVGLMLKHAGVSITVTSLTDVVAFIIGSSTILPCLQSFCIYAGMGVFMIYIFAVTFFTACFTLDQKRLETGRNGIIPCIKHVDYTPNSCSQQDFSNRLITVVYKKIIFTTPGKIIVILITLVCLGFSIESSLKLEKRFDPKWFLPKNTHMYEYVEMRRQYYPLLGFEGGLYTGAVNYTKEINNIRRMVNDIKDLSDTNITTNIHSWVDPFYKFVQVNFQQDLSDGTVSDEQFNMFLSKFLFSPRYAKYQANFRFEHELECGVPVSKIILSSVEFSFHQFSGPSEYIPAMHTTRNIADNSNFTTGEKYATIWSVIFATWITDELIDIEVMRNLQLALLCVMLCTILLIADWQICCWIFVCVLITMVNVCGFMQRWGLTIDLVSCIGLELAIGLCVDYAAHIGHTFLTIQTGTREERSLKTVTSIGAAVLYGGLSTLIGVFMLSQTEAYTFQAFFKIFVLVILFGIFHGIVFLPVLLSWIGPQPYRVHKNVPQCDTELT